MAAFNRIRFVPALVCLLLVCCVLLPSSGSAADIGSDKSAAGPAVTEAAAVSGGIRVSWEADENAAKYAVYRREDEGAWVKYTIVSGTGYTDKNVVFGSTYAYAVRSLDAAGEYVSAIGLVRSLPYGAAPALGPVASVSGGIRFTWAASEGAGGYVVYKMAENGSWIHFAVTADTVYTDRRVLPGISYSYTVRAVDRNGIFMSLYEDQGISGTYIAPPGLLSAVNVGDGIAVSWEETDGAVRYAVYRRTGDEAWGRYTIVSGTSYTDRNTVEGQRYAYTVLALDEKGSAMGGYDPAGLAVTRFSDPEATVREKLLARQTEEGYREGSSWDGGVTRRNTLPRNGCAPGSVSAVGDYAFAMEMQEYAADADAHVRRVAASSASLPVIRSGDVLRLYNGTLSVLVVDVAEDGHTVTVCEGNYGGAVHWGRNFDLSDADCGLSYVETFY